MGTYRLSSRHESEPQYHLSKACCQTHPEETSLGAPQHSRRVRSWQQGNTTVTSRSGGKNRKGINQPQARFGGRSPSKRNPRKPRNGFMCRFCGAVIRDMNHFQSSAITIHLSTASTPGETMTQVSLQAVAHASKCTMHLVVELQHCRRCFGALRQNTVCDENTNQLHAAEVLASLQENVMSLQPANMIQRSIHTGTDSLPCCNTVGPKRRSIPPCLSGCSCL